VAEQISILCPTRGRPDNVKRLVESAMVNAHRPDLLEFVFYVDDDDPTAEQVDLLGDLIKVVRGPRIVLSACWNECYAVATGGILMQCGDDIVFRTARWDKMVRGQFEAYPDRIVLVHGEDGIQGKRVATHGFIHRTWVQVVGYFVPPLFASDYNDMWLTEVADQLGRRVYLSHLYTEHMHPVAGKGPLDRTHRERLDRHNRENCDQIWRDTVADRRRDAQKLLAYMDGFATRVSEFQRAKLAGELAGEVAG
jgi:hypothetical protein